MLAYRQAHGGALAVPALIARTGQDERAVYLPEVGDLNWQLECEALLPIDQYAVVIGTLAWHLESWI